MRVSEKFFLHKYLILNLLIIKELQNYKRAKSNFSDTFINVVLIFLRWVLKIDSSKKVEV